MKFDFIQKSIPGKVFWFFLITNVNKPIEKLITNKQIRIVFISIDFFEISLYNHFNFQHPITDL